MNEYTIKTRYTPKEILNIFIEHHRLCSPLDCEADPSIQINRETTIREWRWANDLERWRKLGQYLNKAYNIEVSEESWKKVLEPAKERKLWDVCKLISSKAIKLEPTSIKIFGQKCISASMFRVLKENLRERGVDVSNMKPSSFLSEYLNDNYEAIMLEITKYEVKVIEKLTMRRKLNKRSIWNRINIFDFDSHEVIPIGIETFRELIEKVIEEKKIACA